MEHDDIPNTKLSGLKIWPNGPDLTESMVPGSRSTKMARGTYLLPVETRADLQRGLGKEVDVEKKKIHCRNPSIETKEGKENGDTKHAEVFRNYQVLFLKKMSMQKSISLSACW